METRPDKKLGCWLLAVGRWLSNKKSKVQGLKSNVQCPRSAVCRLRSAVSPPESSVFVPHSAFRIPHSQAFTLIELLVAMGILMIIVLMMANLFQQSTRAFDQGMRQTGAGLEARAVLGMIQQELSQAVAYTNEPAKTFTAPPGGSDLKFWTLGDPSTTSNELMWVEYTGGGGVSRKVNNALPASLIEAADFTVTPYYSDGAAPDKLPDWVDIKIEMSADRTYSTVRVYAWEKKNDGSTRDFVDTGRGD